MFFWIFGGPFVLCKPLIDHTSGQITTNPKPELTKKWDPGFPKNHQHLGEFGNQRAGIGRDEICPDTC